MARIRTFRRANKRAEAPLDQRGAGGSQQAGPSQVGVGNRSLTVEGQIADRREIVEIAVFFKSRLHLVSGFAELLVLQLQLHLVDLQLVEQPQSAGVGLQRLSDGLLTLRLLPYPRFGPTIKFSHHRLFGTPGVELRSFGGTAPHFGRPDSRCRLLWNGGTFHELRRWK